MLKDHNDYAFTRESHYGSVREPTYGGALPFLRRQYTREPDGGEGAVSGGLSGPAGANGVGAARPRTAEQKALALLDLEEPISFVDVKARYLELVKQLHPDANGGDTEAEEPLKIVNQAYGALKISFA